MKLEMFFDNFDQLADTPNAVARLRELVLQLAVSGKLVDQKPAEGDADELLREIATARVAQGRVKQNGGVAENQITESDCWHDVPVSWRWVRLGAIGEIVGGGTPRTDHHAAWS
jgi:type I restriction enzyme S subunit